MADIRSTPRHPSPEGVAKFASVARRIHDERITAAQTVDRILRDVPFEDLHHLAQNPSLRTCGALERLADIITTVQAQDTNYALAVSRLAVAVADALPEDDYPPVLRAQYQCHAWKDLGKSLRFLARYDDALQALRTAEDLIHEYGSLAYERAVVQVNIAAVLQETGRYDESLALLTNCKHTFAEYGDTQNVIRTVLLEGTLLQRRRQYREARKAYLLLLDSPSGISTESRAAIELAIGFTSIELADFPHAEEYLTRAIILFRELGQPLNATRGELGRGRLLLRKGDFARAIAHLRTVRRDFLSNSLPEEAGLCGLEIVQGLLILERAGEAEQLSRKIVHEFTTAKLNTRAVAALAYLSEAITMKRASASLVVHVHEYVLSLRTEPEREFDMQHAMGLE